MIIDQILPTIVPGDAVSNECLRMQEILAKAGIVSRIYAENIHPSLSNRVLHYSKYSNSIGNILIFHYSIGSDITAFIRSLKCKKIMRYHNITPYKYFISYNDMLAHLCRKGRDDLETIKSDFYLSIADSAYNERELVDIGYKNIKILPIMLNFKNFEDVAPNKKISARLNSKKNIIFVGKIAPHKAQKDLVNIFYYYHKYINSDSRLIMIGSYEGFEKYHEELLAYIKVLNLKDVIITGKISLQDLVTYYKNADLFLCTSEHEGFCVPLVEAMYFNIPILAYGSTAIPDTLKGSGVIFKRKSEPYKIAEMMDLMLTDDNFRDKIISKQRQVLANYDPSRLEKRFKEFIGIKSYGGNGER